MKRCSMLIHYTAIYGNTVLLYIYSTDNVTVVLPYSYITDNVTVQCYCTVSLLIMLQYSVNEL